MQVRAFERYIPLIPAKMCAYFCTETATSCGDMHMHKIYTFTNSTNLLIANFAFLHLTNVSQKSFRI